MKAIFNFRWLMNDDKLKRLHNFMNNGKMHLDISADFNGIKKLDPILELPLDYLFTLKLVFQKNSSWTKDDIKVVTNKSPCLFGHPVFLM